MFYTHLLSSGRHLVVKINFWIFHYGENAISTARGRSRPEVTSSNDTATMVSYYCSIHVSGLVCTIHELHAIFFNSQKVAICQFRRLGSVLDRNGVTNRKLDPGFPPEFNTHFLFDMHRFKVILDFANVNFGVVNFDR
jgi:hypothetical protein